MSDSHQKQNDDSEETEALEASRRLDGSDFLSHLRAAQLLSYGSNNEDTVGASNTTADRHGRDISSLSGLFDNPSLDELDTDTSMEQQQQQQQHVGSPSSTGAPPRPSPQRNRTVSWNKSLTTSTPPPPLQQRSPNHPSHPSSAAASTLMQLQQPILNEPNNNDSPTPRFQLDDLLSSGPYEHEAETNILKAVEEQQHAAQRERADTGTSTILSGVPETMAHDFTLPTNDDNETRSDSQRPQQQQEKEEMEVKEALREADHETIPVATRSREGMSQRREQSRALLNQQQQQQQQPQRPQNHHRRLMSVEDTLAGLTNAMTALDQGLNGMAAIETIPEDEEADDEALPSTTPTSTGVQLAENAALLTRHNGDENNEDEQRKQRQTAKDRWNHVLDNLPTLREAEERHGRESDETERESDNERDSHQDVETGVSPSSDPSSSVPPKSNKRKKGRRSFAFRVANGRLKGDLETWNNFFSPRKEHVWSYIKVVLLYLILPLASIAAILYYAVDNPPTGKGAELDSQQASASWWLLFTVRQVITLSMALCMQMVIIDFLAIGTRVILRLVGPVLTLLLVQSKGWPFVVFWWSVFDFAMLYGNNAFSAHWLFWQDVIGLFNSRNPSGNVVNSVWNMRVLTIAITVSAAVAVKRFVVGLFLSRQTYAHFGTKLAKVMHKMLLVSEVAGLGLKIEKAANSGTLVFPKAPENFAWDRHHPDLSIAPSDDEESNGGGASIRRDSVIMDNKVINMSNRDPLTGTLDSSERLKIMQLLERWEEPDKYYHYLDEAATISAVLRFRNALALIQKAYPFSYAFGPADSREACIDSAQRVYSRLLLRTPGQNVLQFETLALLALQHDGTIDQQKAKSLVKLFRPDRQGNLTMLDFLKSTDQVYKEYRLLLATIQNSSRIDRSLEMIMNVIFYAIVVTIIIAALGFDPLAVFVAVSSVILAFAFMIGTASSKYFEGVLFVLIRRPYSIGDLMNVSHIESQTSFDGSPGWLVENMTLFETVATWAPTNERASLNNGSLASSRIINWARSPQAQFHIHLNFPIDTPYEKILIFKRAVEEYMKERPREWLSLNGFRASRILPEKGFVEYTIVIQHRDSWQNIGQILDGKANLSSYCMEVSKQLGMNYRAPPLPVNLNYTGTLPAAVPEATGAAPAVEAEDMDDETRIQTFRSIVRKHNIRVN